VVLAGGRFGTGDQLGAAAGLVIPGRTQAAVSAIPARNHSPKIEIRS